MLRARSACPASPARRWGHAPRNRNVRMWSVGRVCRLVSMFLRRSVRARRRYQRSPFPSSGRSNHKARLCPWPILSTRRRPGKHQPTEASAHSPWKTPAQRARPPLKLVLAFSSLNNSPPSSQGIYSCSIASSHAVVSQIVSSVCVLSPLASNPIRHSSFTVAILHHPFCIRIPVLPRCSVSPCSWQTLASPSTRMYAYPLDNLSTCTRFWPHCRIPAAASCFGARHLVYGADPRPATHLTSMQAARLPQPRSRKDSVRALPSFDSPDTVTVLPCVPLYCPGGWKERIYSTFASFACSLLA